MQKTILPQVERTGGLKNVVFVYVDYDQQRQLASRLTDGMSIPQLIRFDHTQAGWTNKRLIGARSPGEVHSFINGGLFNESRRPSKNDPGVPRPSAIISGPSLTEEENNLRTAAKLDENSTTVQPQHGPHSSASNKTITAPPVASQPWIVSPVNPPVGQQWVVEPFYTKHAENVEKPSERTPFFKRLFRKNKNQHDETTL